MNLQSKSSARRPPPPVVTFAATTRSKGSLGRREAWWGFIFISPWIVGFLVFTLGPMVASFYLAFTSFDALTAPRFVGLANYRSIFTADDLFWRSLWVTASYVLIYVPAHILGSFIVALVLNQGIRGRTVYRSLFFVSSVVPSVAAVFLWTWLLNSHYGLVNYLLSLIGIHGPSWLGDPSWARQSLAIIAIWGSIGGTSAIILLAALQGIPRHLYEAASIDGANRIRSVVHITVPLLTPTLFFLIVLSIIGSFQTFTTAYVATQGGPDYSTYFYILYLYEKGFKFNEMGYASALAWIVFVILMCFTWVQFQSARRWVYYADDN